MPSVCWQACDSFALFLTSRAPFGTTSIWTSPVPFLCLLAFSFTRWAANSSGSSFVGSLRHRCSLPFSESLPPRWEPVLPGLASSTTSSCSPPALWLYCYYSPNGCVQDHADG